MQNSIATVVQQAPAEPLEQADIQGLIASGYGHLYHSRYFFLRVDDAALVKTWLASIAAQVTVAERPKVDGHHAKPAIAVNIALTWPGLAALGLSKESLGTFPQEFREGMGQPYRATRLGDFGPSAPSTWEIGKVDDQGNPLQNIHILLILQTPTESDLDVNSARMRREFAAQGLREECPAQTGRRLPRGREHFGFHDSISQPEIAGIDKPGKETQSHLKAGEFILGYKNSYDLLPATPMAPAQDDPHGALTSIKHAGDSAEWRDLGRNGSYLVFRKLEQDVATFRSFFAENFPDRQDEIAAKCVGRWPGGAPLTLSPDKDDPDLSTSNDFAFAEADSQGFKCPIGSHIRRANPRDSFRGTPQESVESVDRHRILRRGASYGDALPEGTIKDDGKSRGLLFICVNADIKRQFEFLQQSWINNPKFLGLYNDPDPLIGSSPAVEELDGMKDLPQMTIQQDPVRLRVHGIPRFVTMRGGGYFFLPSISALYFLAGTTKP